MTKFSGDVQAVFFDFGDTLAYRARPIFEIWEEIGAEHGTTLREEDFGKARTAADTAFEPQVYEFKGRMKEFWNQYHSYVLASLQVGDPSGDLLRALNSALPNTTKWYELFPESIDVLSTLKKRGYELGLITNSTETIIERLKDLGLDSYLGVVVYSQEVGTEKPDSAPFKLALHRAGRSAGECVFVGDNLEADIRGASSIGMEPVLIDRKGKYPNAGCATIHNLNELLD